MDGSEFTPAESPDRSRKVWVVWLVSTLIIAILIAILTLMPTPHMPRSNSHWDKFAHLTAFLVLVFPTAALWPRVTAWIGLAAVLYGGVIELIQPFTGRSAELGDLLADGIGVGLGIILGASLRRAVILRRVQRAR